MSWAAVAASAISAGVGIYQTQKGKKLAEQAGERPEFDISIKIFTRNPWSGKV